MENLYLKEKNKKDCNGCGACIYVCPKHCIHMEEDEEGFFYPVIHEEECIHCNKCKNICSNYSKEQKEINKAYIASNTCEEERKNSASGGMFYILAKYVIEKNGVVFGVKYNEDLTAVHDYATTLEECKSFMGSKYVRSKTEGIYEKVKEFLMQEKYVLFTGTPCQIAGLKTFLNKEYEKLLTCEIICHANPSPKIFRKYVEELEQKKALKVKDIKFRSKENGWDNSTPIIEYENGEKEEDITFYKGFIAELFNRPSCHSCVFVGNKGYADFTIGDLWGIQKIAPEMNDNKGVSLLIVNSNKAEKIFLEIKENLSFKPIDVDLALSYNHATNSPMHPKREKFFKVVNQEGNVIKYIKKYTKPSLWRRIKRKLKRILVNN